MKDKNLGSISGYLRLSLNEDKTQVLGNIIPPQGGQPVTFTQVIERLQRMGVEAGIKEENIREVVKKAEEEETGSYSVVFAEGQMPTVGRDARAIYSIPEEVLRELVPFDDDGWPNYFALNPAKMVRAGQEIVSILPAEEGKPGYMVVPPYQVVRGKKGREIIFSKGENVECDEDHLRWWVTSEGYLTLDQDKLAVKPLRVINGDVANDIQAPGSLVINGDIKGATVTARGVVAVNGLVEDSRIRSHGECIINHARNSWLIVDEEIRVLGSLFDCDVIVGRRLVTKRDASVVGGRITAERQVIAGNLLVSSNGAPKVMLNRTTLVQLKLAEIREEIEEHEAKLRYIDQAYRVLVHNTATTMESEKRRQALALIQHQRRAMENTINMLHGETRSTRLNGNHENGGEVIVYGQAAKGLRVQIGAIGWVSTDNYTGCTFSADKHSGCICVLPLVQPSVAAA